MKFLCDHMLGTLAKWLRFLGNDVAYPGPVDDNELIALAGREDRTLLTRDRELSERMAGSLFVASDDLDAQLVQVLRHFDLKPDLSMTRCSVCNAPLQRIQRSEVRGKVPDGVYERQQEFWRCASCGRFYWQGSHWESMSARVRGIRERAGESTA